MLPLALVIRFALELCLLAVAGWLPYHLWPTPIGLAASAASVVTLLLVWGALISPKRRLELGAPSRLALEAALFGLAATALATTGRTCLAAALLAVALIDRWALALLSRSDSGHTGGAEKH